MWQHIGACRYMWNYLLELQEKRYENGEKHLHAYDMSKLITQLKKNDEYKWLCDISQKSIQQICRDLDDAYDMFFKKISRKPKFKSKKKSKQVYPVRIDRFYFKDDKFLNIEKIGKVRYKTDFTFPIGRCAQNYCNVRALHDNGKWFVSFAIECESQAPELTEINMGIDLGIKDLAVVEFNGEQITFHNINRSKKMKALNNKLVHMQRSISRKYEQNKQGKKYIKTNNIIREEEKLRKIHAKITNIRKNYMHQTTHELVSMLPKRVVMEDLDVSGMMKNRRLSKEVQQQCFYEFIRQMKYKCEWNCIEFVQADRFFPSSKTCSECGCIKNDLKLSDRVYVCNHCGLVIDRDYNAAVNLSKYVA